jgi:hypothetical protein
MRAKRASAAQSGLCFAHPRRVSSRARPPPNFRVQLPLVYPRRAAPPKFLCTVSRGCNPSVYAPASFHARGHDACTPRDAIAHKDNKHRGVGAQRLLFLKPLLKEKKIRRNRSSSPLVCRKRVARGTSLSNPHRRASFRKIYTLYSVS